MTIFLLIPLDNACKVFTKLIFTFLVRINTLKFILRMQQGDKCHSKQWILDNISLFCFCSWEKKESLSLSLLLERGRKRKRKEWRWRERKVFWIFVFKTSFLHKTSYSPFLYILNWFSFSFLCISVFCI